MIRRFYTTPLLLILAAIVAGCTSTEVHSFRNDDLVGKYYDRILLVVDIPNANDRDIAETKFMLEFQARGLELLPASDIIPNLHSMTEAELLAILEKKDVHSVLTLTPASAMDLLSTREEVQKYKAKNLQWANDLLYFDNPAPVYPKNKDLYTGVYGEFSLRLIDFQTGKVAWLGISQTERTGLANIECMMEHNAKKTVETLGQEKLIVPLIAAD